MQTEPFRKTFLRRWLRCLLVLFVGPLAVTCLLLFIPFTRLLALLPAFLLSLPACFLVGGEHFSPEFCIPVSGAGYAWVVGTWFAVATVVALFISAWSRRRSPAAPR